MNRTEKSDLLRKQLQMNVSKLQSAAEMLEYSFRKCRKLKVFSPLSPEELESFEALTSRFARVADVLVQKVLVTLFILLKEPQNSIIDRINRAAKLSIIPDSDDLLEIRDVRNEISHEYADANLLQLFADVISLSPKLKVAVRKTDQFCRSFLRSVSPKSSPTSSSERKRSLTTGKK